MTFYHLNNGLVQYSETQLFSITLELHWGSLALLHFLSSSLPKASLNLIC